MLLSEYLLKIKTTTRLCADLQQRPLLLGLVALVEEGGGEVPGHDLVPDEDQVEPLQFGQPQRDHLPANQVSAHK